MQFIAQKVDMQQTEDKLNTVYSAKARIYLKQQGEED